MHNSKFIQLLKTLHTRERTKFKNYVHSPFFNKHKGVIALLDYTLQFSPPYQEAELSKTIIFQELFPTAQWDEDKMNNLISDLLQLLYDFLAQTVYQSDKILQKQFLLDVLSKKEEWQHVNRTARRLKQLQQKTPIRNHQFFQQASQFHEKLDRYELLIGKRKFNEHLQLQSNYLDTAYLMNKLRLACDMESRNTVIKAGYDCHFLEDILNFYKNNRYALQEIPVLQVYYKTLLMLKNRQENTHYQDLKQLLLKYTKHFPADELLVLYNYILNYGIQKINSGQSHFYHEILEVYKVLLEQKMLLLNGYLTQWAFKNITTVGIRLKEFAWTKQFIENYQNYLLPQEKANAVAYNLAAFYYAKQEYSKALQQLQDVEFTDTSYHLGAKIIQVKSYFELNETEAFYSLLEAFRTYIRRNREISDYRKKANANFLKLSKWMYQLKIIKATKKKSIFQKRWKEIKERLETTEPLANKDWLEGIILNMKCQI